ncbi:TatD family hydrolase [Desulfotignum phosphitoxidans]|jgi:TatD DNase family protein|uniref:Hydrolase, TatD family n=2 Tax=Desulfotignum TaxID=115780 RepID=S0FSP5_9BACT|nr:TatD family hydrolase [Desulfotignum phosphitoxidans]EMS78113.1 hydrolase, TatD family [Desulfotignum phosphitoxidans DSM 13687]MBG0779258.1 TatD family hydrolase [Desulfotignum balticum]
MILFDSHCHIDDPCFEQDMDAMFERARNAGVLAMTIAGVNADMTRKAIDIAARYDNVITAVGIHPHDAAHCAPDILDGLICLAKENGCVKAWGETGLDFNRMFSPQKDQEACLKAQLAIAGELDLPLIFHERDSMGRFYEIVKSEGPASRKGVVHCFSGTRKEMFQYLDLGYHIGITGILTIQKRGRLLRELAPLIPEDRILIETDAPYLTPAPQKNKVRRNEPAFVASVLTTLARVRNQDPEDLAVTIFNNTNRFFSTNFT